MASMKLHNPFQRRKIKPTPVIPIGDGHLYFAKMGYATANLMPVSLQEKDEQVKKYLKLVWTVAKRISEEMGISEDDATALVTGRPVDGLEVSVDPQKYMSVDERVEMTSLATERSNVAVKAATCAMQSRLLYDIQLSEPAKAKSKKLAINEPWHIIEVGSKFKSEELGLEIEVTEPYNLESGTIGIKPLAIDLEAGAVFFKMRGGNYLMGDPKWVEADTLEQMSIESGNGELSDVARLYQFYQEEIGNRGLEEVEESEDEGKQLASVNKSLPSTADE